MDEAARPKALPPMAAIWKDELQGGAMTHVDFGSPSGLGASGASDDKRTERLLAAYAEVCRSYHAVDDFRAKLLGILPIASLAGILLVSKDSLFAAATAQPLVGFGSFFAAAFTLSLFLFEIRGILRCHHLIERGEALEAALEVKGQFYVCAHQQAVANDSGSERIFNAKVAASAIYSLVFAAWLFMALRFTFGLTIMGCGLTATAVGGLLAVGAHAVVNKRIAA
jgi:hypothetical protein